MIKRIAVISVLTFLAATSWLAGDDRDSRRPGIKAPLPDAQRAAAADQAKPAEGKILYYQDPMHPWYHSDKPGIAPDCGMKLVPVYAGEGPTALPPGGVDISPARQQMMGVTTAEAEYRDRPDGAVLRPSGNG